MHDTADSYDSPWKEALQHFFPDFLAFFFPDAHADIDWRRGHEFLDKELQQIVRDAELGRRFADTLARVWRQDGEEAWVLQLPPPQALDFWQQMQEIEEEKRMRYITSVEQIGMEKGIEQGLQQGMQKGMQQGMQKGLQQGMQKGQADLVLRLLDRRFGAVPARLADWVRGVPSEQMPDLLDVALTAVSLEEVATAAEALAVETGAGASS